MPYSIANPPDRIRDLPEHAQKIWISAFNAALQQYKDEGKANAVAWSAITKAGYHKNEKGEWVKREGEMILSFELGELCAEQVDIKSTVDIAKLTEGDPSPFFPTVRALKIGISGNKKRYSMEILKKVKEQLPVYGYLGHIKEEETSYKYRDPVTIWFGGEILNDWLYVKGYVPPTEDRLRKQIALSLRANKPLPVSILGENLMKFNKDYWDVLDIRLISIDWAPSGLEGIQGANVVNISKEQISKEVNMTREEILAGLTLDEIKKERPDLVQSLSSEMANSDEEKKKRAAEAEKLKTLEAENLKLKTDTLNAHKEKLLGEIKDEKVREIAKDLLQGESIEKLDANWKLTKEKLGKLEKPGMPILTGQGDKKPGSDFLQDRLLTA
jgi:cation transport regulator ChaB